MNLAYGSSVLPFQPESDVTWQMLPAEEPGAAFMPDPVILDRAMEALLRQLDNQGVSRGDQLLLVIPDHTRRCRLETILPRLLPRLESELSLKIRLLVANGSHVLQPEALVREVVGEEVFESYTVRQHDARDESWMHSLGETTAGTPVAINRMALEADWIVTIGGILYHYFAGFGGGPKMLLPGIAALETIRINHRRTIDPATGQFHAGCREGNIETNPVYHDLAEVVRFFPRALSLQLVLSPSGEIAAAAAGPILSVQNELLPMVRRFYGVPVRDPADIVIASAGGYPADVNLIQAHKSIHHAFQALKPGGTLIVLAECREGIGSAAFLGYFTGASSREMGRELLRNYLINGHTAMTLKSKSEQARIILVSELDGATVRRTGMIPAASLDEAWALAKVGLPAAAAGYIMPKASKYLPLHDPS
jgi:lactate racemase